MSDAHTRRRRERLRTMRPHTMALLSRRNASPGLVPGASDWRVIGACVGGIAGLFALAIVIVAVGYKPTSALPGLGLAVLAIFGAVLGLGAYTGSMAAGYLCKKFKHNHKGAR